MSVEESNWEASVEFCKVTGLQDDDISIAQFYLEETDWKVEDAVKNYRRGMADAQKFDDPALVADLQEGDGRPQHSNDPPSEASSSTTTRNPTIPPASHNASVTASAFGDTAGSSTQPPKDRIRLVTWNIDGLDERNVGERTVGACDTLKLLAPDIVFLQEVVSATCDLVHSRMTDYLMIPSSDELHIPGMYCTAIMLKKSSTQVVFDKVHPFPGSCMARTLQIVQAKCLGVELTLLCSHLESTKQHSKERMNQLKIAMDHMKKAPATSTVVFGGDCNLRDTEVTKIGGLPLGVFDIWQLCGEPPDAKFTWDLSQNTNLDWPHPGRPKCRFDRLYLRHCGPKQRLTAESFTLTGKKKLDGCRRFPSDHWGIVCDFKIGDQVK